MRRAKQFLDNEQGSGLVEIAAVLIALLMVFFGIMDCSRALYADLYVGYAAHAAARYAMVRGSTWNGTACAGPTSSNCAASGSNIKQVVQSMAPLGIDTGPTVLTTTSSWPGINASGSACNSSGGTNSPGCLVEVSVSYQFNFVLPFLPRAPLTMKSVSEVTIAQ